MAQTLAHTRFHHSTFIRILADLIGAEPMQAGSAFAEKLAEWIHIADAIALRSTHTPTARKVASDASAKAQLAGRAADALERTRAALEAKMAWQETAPAKPRTSRSGMAIAAAVPPTELAGSFEPLRRHYIRLQQEMELKLKPLRSHARESASKASPALHQLALLDAAMENILSEREAVLLAKVPTLLEKRFKHLRQTHEATLAAAQIEDNVQLWTQPGGWLARARQEMHALLRAELDLRLQPTLGLLEALQHETLQHV